MVSNNASIDPRARRTRNLIENAFLELINEKTLHAVSVGEIADRATINRVTFYSHFSDKYALFDHIVRRSYQQTLQDHQLNGSGFNPENIKRLIIATCYYFVTLNEQYPPAERQIRPLAETQIQVVLNEKLFAWLSSDGNIKDPELVATFLSWAVFGTAMEIDSTQITGEVEALAERIYRLAIRLLDDIKEN